MLSITLALLPYSSYSAASLLRHRRPPEGGERRFFVCQSALQAHLGAVRTGAARTRFIPKAPLTKAIRLRLADFVRHSACTHSKERMHRYAVSFGPFRVRTATPTSRAQTDKQPFTVWTASMTRELLNAGAGTY